LSDTRTCAVGSLFWFKKERDTPAAIAKQLLSMLRAGIEV
jgi:hypothetical protein